MHSMLRPSIFLRPKDSNLMRARFCNAQPVESSPPSKLSLTMKSWSCTKRPNTPLVVRRRCGEEGFVTLEYKLLSPPIGAPRGAELHHEVRLRPLRYEPPRSNRLAAATY